MTTRLLALVVGVCIAVSGCTATSRSTDDYRHKVANTAQAVHSSLSAAKLQMDLVKDDKTFVPALRIAIYQTLSDATSTVSGFDAIRPPNEESIHLRTRADEALRKATTVLGRARDLVGNDRSDELPGLIKDVDDAIDALRPLEELA